MKARTEQSRDAGMMISEERNNGLVSTYDATKSTIDGRAQLASERTQIGCRIQAGPSYTKLLRYTNQDQAIEETFCLQFVQYQANKRVVLTNGQGMPVRIRLERIAHASAAGLYAEGVITHIMSTSFYGHGSIRNAFRDLVSLEWFQPGYRVRILHRGSASTGRIIAVVRPDDHKILKFCTKA